MFAIISFVIDAEVGIATPNERFSLTFAVSQTFCNVRHNIDAS